MNSVFGYASINWGKMRVYKHSEGFFDRRYVSSRLKDPRYRDKPVNQVLADRLCFVFERILDGKTDYPVEPALSAILELIEKASGLHLPSDYAIPSPDPKDYQQRCNVLMHLFRLTLYEMNGKSEVEKENLSATLQKRVSESALPQGIEMSRGRDNLPYGVKDFFFNVIDVRYPDLLTSAMRSITIAHFHGLSWTNQHREYILQALSKPGLHFKVLLLNPESEFFDPYARFIRVSPDYLSEKTAEVITIWKRMYQECLDEFHTAATLELFFDWGFPAKSIYQFDDVIVVTPNTNAQPKAQFMAYCCENTGGEESAFAIYKKELDWLAESGVLIERLTPSNR